MILLHVLAFLTIFTVTYGSIESPQKLAENDGYFKREHSLTQPYQGRGFEIPFWEFGGFTIVSKDYIRLTPDRQSKQGSLWNSMPMSVHNWEMLLQFSVHGSGKALFGDGFAMWYTKNKNVKGPVFGNQDYFTGLAIFFDTYSNHNGEHSHEHPYISAMINNGSIHYDHDRDGTHSQVSGCHAKFRNSNEDTFVAISYINRQLIVMTNFDGSGTWTPCFLVNNVDLPTGYYFGFTAATGDLADNHDIVSVKVYDVEQSHDNNVKDKEAQPTQQAVDWSTVMPHAANQEPPRAHVADVPNMITPFWYRFFSFSFLLVLVVAVIALIGGFAWKKKQERNRKRFF